MTEPTPATDSTLIGESALEVRWVFPDQRVLRLLANLGSRTVTHPGPMPHWGRQIYPPGPASADWSDLPPWSVRWHLSEASR